MAAGRTVGGFSRGGWRDERKVLMLRLCGDRDGAVCVSNKLKDGWAESQGWKYWSLQPLLAFSIYKQRCNLRVFASCSTDWEILGWKCHPWTHRNLIGAHHAISFLFICFPLQTAATSDNHSMQSLYWVLSMWHQVVEFIYKMPESLLGHTKTMHTDWHACKSISAKM